MALGGGGDLHPIPLLFFSYALSSFACQMKKGIGEEICSLLRPSPYLPWERGRSRSRAMAAGGGGLLNFLGPPLISSFLGVVPRREVKKKERAKAK